MDMAKPLHRLRIQHPPFVAVDLDEGVNGIAYLVDDLHGSLVPFKYRTCVPALSTHPYQQGYAVRTVESSDYSPSLNAPTPPPAPRGATPPRGRRRGRRRGP